MPLNSEREALFSLVTKEDLCGGLFKIFILNMVITRLFEIAKLQWLCAL